MSCVKFDKFEVEKNIPIPSSKGKIPMYFPFDDLEKGDSFAVPIALKGALCSQRTARHQMNKNVRYVLRTVENKSMMRCWRYK